MRHFHFQYETMFTFNGPIFNQPSYTTLCVGSLEVIVWKLSDQDFYRPARCPLYWPANSVKALVIGMRSTSRQCCSHCTGCLLNSGLSTNSQHWSVSASLDVHQHSSSWHEIGWYFDARGSTNKNCTRWWIICRRRPSYLEQSATQHSWFDTVGGNICKTVENLPVCLRAVALVFLN